MANASRNWVFLGDSLTEGVGSKRISYVGELAQQLRAAGGAINVHEFRIRRSEALNSQVDFNIAGLMKVGKREGPADLWLWNFAAEGQTIEADFEWVPLISALRPELVMIFRGSLESIIRPEMVFDNRWPWWLPRAWRNYSAMDPRCYFSTTWWRRARQVCVDATKQKARLSLLKRAPGKPLMQLDQLAQTQNRLLRQLRALAQRVLVLGLLPVDDARFPDSSAHFEAVNTALKEAANAAGVEFFDWASSLAAKGPHAELFYRDGFHPNQAGARALAELLHEYLRRDEVL